MLGYGMILGALAIGMMTQRHPYNHRRYHRPYPPVSLGANAATLLFLLILILFIWRDVLLK